MCDRYRIIWNELANKDYETDEYKYRMSLYRVVMTAVAVGLSIATIVLLVEGNFATLGIVYATGAVGLLIIFAFGVSRYRRVLEAYVSHFFRCVWFCDEMSIAYRSRQGDDRVDALVVRTAITFFPALVGLAISVVVFAVLVFVGVKEYSPRDSVSLVALFLETFIVCGWIMQTCIYYYLRNLLILQIDTILVMTGAKKQVLQTQVSYSGSAMYADQKL